MTCSKCGASNLEGAKFCDACGAKLEVAVPGGDAKTRFCSSCGASLKPSARFCGSCGAAQSGAAAAPSAPAPQPAPSAPAPVAAPAYQVPAPQTPPPTAYQTPAPHATRPKSKGCRTGCMVLAVLLVGLAAGGYYLWNNVVLSNPAALVGTWQIDAAKSGFMSEKFALEPIHGGVMLVPSGPNKWPFELVLRPGGNRTFGGMVTNSIGEPSGVTIVAELRSPTTLNLKATMPDGSTEEAEATRVLGSDNR